MSCRAANPLSSPLISGALSHSGLPPRPARPASAPPATLGAPGVLAVRSSVFAVVSAIQGAGAGLDERGYVAFCARYRPPVRLPRPSRGVRADRRGRAAGEGDLDPTWSPHGHRAIIHGIGFIVVRCCQALARPHLVGLLPATTIAWSGWPRWLALAQTRHLQRVCARYPANPHLPVDRVDVPDADPLRPQPAAAGVQRLDEGQSDDRPDCRRARSVAWRDARPSSPRPRWSPGSRCWPGHAPALPAAREGVPVSGVLLRAERPARPIRAAARAHAVGRVRRILLGRRFPQWDAARHQLHRGSRRIAGHHRRERRRQPTRLADFRRASAQFRTVERSGTMARCWTGAASI